MREAITDKDPNAELRQLRERIKRLERLEERQAAMLREARLTIRELKRSLSKLGSELESYQDPEGVYNPGWSLIAKVVFVLRKLDMPLRTVDIAHELGKIDAAFLEKADLAAYLPVVLTKAMAHKRVVYHRVKDVSGHFYTLPEWIGKKGNPGKAPGKEV